MSTYPQPTRYSTLLSSLLFLDREIGPVYTRNRGGEGGGSNLISNGNQMNGISNKPEPPAPPLSSRNEAKPILESPTALEDLKS